MFEILLIVAQWWLHNQSDRPAVRSTSRLATVAMPEWSHATPFRADELPNDLPWLTPEEVAGIVDGVPPSPAILNARGWTNAVGVFGPFLDLPRNADATPIDSRNDPKDLSPVTAELADVIDRWEKASTLSPKVFEFHRITYDLSREVETRATGLFQYVSQNEGALCFADEGSMSTPVSYRKNVAGERFIHEASSSEEWRWSNEEVLYFNNSNKTYSIAPLPKAVKHEADDHFRQMIEAHAPFIIDVRSDVIRREWSFTLRQQNDNVCILEAIPRTAARRQYFNKCLIRLDAISGRLKAVKYVDADQVHETVYVINRCREVKPQINKGCFPLGGDRHKGYVLAPMTWP